METKLIQFPNSQNSTLRSILTLPSQAVKKVVICLHGFERNSSVEKKFKSLSDLLSKENIATFRLDFAGCGLSDGNFENTSISSQSEDFLLALDKIKEIFGDVKIGIIAHSMGACVLAEKLDFVEIEKIVLIAPALNQKDLLRYWFVSGLYKDKIDITWQNYKDYLNEKDFFDNYKGKKIQTKTNYIKEQYFSEASKTDYSRYFENINTKILFIHGKNDKKVPLESINIDFENKLIIENGDHDLEKPDIINQWSKKVMNFLN